MLEFNEIYKLATTGQKLPPHSPPEEKMAYYELMGIMTAYKKKFISPKEDSTQKLLAMRRFDECREGRLLNLEAYKEYQNNIKAGECKLSELFKKIEPNADYKELLGDALDIIALYEGHEGSTVYRKILDGAKPLSARANKSA